MQLPTISQYSDSIANPHGLLRTLDEFEAERDLYGNVTVRAGNNAAVFRVISGSRILMLKCYIKNSPNLTTIHNYLDTIDDELISKPKLCTSELYVYDAFDNGEYYDIVIADWVEGNTLETEIKRAASERNIEKLKELSLTFDKLACELLSREWAHGDLKPDNIIVDPADGHMTLIDYDAMFIPSLKGGASPEIGTPAYQHPKRKSENFSKHIDDYSIAIISVSLHALSCDPSLYLEYHRSDNIILHPEEIITGTSEAYEKVLDLFADNHLYHVYALALKLRSPSFELDNLHNSLNLILCRPTRPELQTKTELQIYNENGLWGFSDDFGNIIVEPIFEDATEFREGYSLIRLKGRNNIIDTKCETIFKINFESLKPFSCGLAAAKKNGKWGFVDINGIFVIEAIYEEVNTMRENIAAIKTNGKWGFIKSSGEILVEPEYEVVTSFRNGEATLYRQGKTFYSDASGNIMTR